MFLKPTAILIHVPDVSMGLDWYQRAFSNAVAQYLPDFDFTLLHINDFTLEIVQADEKVGAGKKGTVLYWAVESLDEAIAHLTHLGAKLYRGPMLIDNDLRMCQLSDPFGNLIGLKGY